MSLHLCVLSVQLLSLACIATIASGAPKSVGGEAETRWLSLLSTLPLASTLEQVKRAVPELTKVHDQGWGNTTASFPVRLFGRNMVASFSFHDGKLVSHGVSQRALQKDAALRVYQAVRRRMSRQYGRASESHGPRQDAPAYVAWSANWMVKGKVIGVYCEKLYDGYQVGWGAQAAE